MSNIDPRSSEGAAEVGRQMARTALAILTDPKAENAGAALVVDPFIEAIERLAAGFVQEGMVLSDALAWAEAVREAFGEEVERLVAIVRLSGAEPAGSA